MYSRKEAGVRHSTLNPPSPPLLLVSTPRHARNFLGGIYGKFTGAPGGPLFGISPSQGNGGEQTEAVWVGSPFPYLEESESGKTFIFGL